MGARRLTVLVLTLALGSLVLPGGLALPALAHPGAVPAPVIAQNPHGDPGEGHGRGRGGKQNQQNEEGAPQAERGGVLHGRVAGVDFGSNVLLIDAGGVRRRIVLTPTTTLEMRGNRGLSIADLRPGQRVDVFVTIIHGVPIAQIVRLH